MRLHLRTMALVNVVPIDHVERPIRSLPDVDDLARAIVEIDEVVAVGADESAAFPLGNIGIDALAVDIPHKDLSRPVPERPLNDRQSCVGVTTASRVAHVISLVRIGADIMAMVRDGLDVVVGVRVEMLSRLSLVTRSLDDME